MRPHQVPDRGKGLGGRGLLRGPGRLRGERHPGDAHQSVHLLQGLPLSPDVRQRPDAHAVRQRHLPGAASGLLAVKRQ